MGPELPGFTQFMWDNDGTEKPVYHIGELDRPPVVLMHELPGMVPETVTFARDLADEGFSVFMPLLFGVPNASKAAIVPYTLRVCLSREYTLFAKGKSSPVTHWLRSLCREAKRRCGDRHVGVIGMCLTGNFALALMTDDSVLAPVLSQPSMPIGLTKAYHADLATSPDELDAATQRSKDENIPLLGLRFTCDPLCREDRFAALEARFGERFRKIEIDSSRGNPHGLPINSHSVLTVHRTREEGHPTQDAYHKVVAFLQEQLL